MGKPKYPLFSQVNWRREKRGFRSGETCFETNCTFKHVDISKAKKETEWISTVDSDKFQ